MLHGLIQNATPPPKCCIIVMEYIQYLFKWYGVQIDNIVTGTSRKNKAAAEKGEKLRALAAQQYSQSIHLDAGSLVHFRSGTKSYEDFALSGNPQTWAQEVMEIVGKLDQP